MIRLEKSILRNKLAMCMFGLASFTGTADAAQILVFEKPLEPWGQEISAGFAVNRELGRAWIDVALNSTFIGEEPGQPEVISKRIEGLYYDSTRKQVLYRAGNQTIVCAEDGKFLWSTYLKTTGQCPVTSVAERRQVDDGFNTSERTVGKVVLEVGN